LVLQCHIPALNMRGFFIVPLKHPDTQRRRYADALCRSSVKRSESIPECDGRDQRVGGGECVLLQNRRNDEKTSQAFELWEVGDAISTSYDGVAFNLIGKSHARCE